LRLYFLSSNVRSQNQLFTLVCSNDNVVELSQVNFLNSLIDKGYYSDFMIVKVGDLKSCQKNGEVFFTIPGKESLMGAISQQVDYTSSTKYHWFGNIEYQYPGYFSLTRSEDGIAGFIQLPNKSYIILPLGDNIVAIMTGNFQKEVVCSDEYNEHSDVLHFPPATICSQDDVCSGVIDVLVLVSRPAAEFLNGTKKPLLNVVTPAELAVLNDAFQSVNTAFENSGMLNTL
jgi:hypothetical protein